MVHIYSVRPKTLRYHFSFRSIVHWQSLAHILFPFLLILHGLRGVVPQYCGADKRHISLLRTLMKKGAPRLLTLKGFKLYKNWLTFKCRRYLYLNHLTVHDLLSRGRCKRYEKTNKARISSPGIATKLNFARGTFHFYRLEMFWIKSIV